MELMQIGDMLFSVLTESFLGGIKSHYWTRLENRALEETPRPGEKQREITHRRRTSVHSYI